jgi:hypothetical protein
MQSTGFIDRRGTVVIPPTLNVGPFSEGRASFFVRDSASRRLQNGYIDRTGLPVISPTFDAALPFTEGLAAVRVGADTAGRWGFIDPQGNLVIKPQFNAASLFSEGLAPVQVGKKWGYISR